MKTIEQVIEKCEEEIAWADAANDEAEEADEHWPEENPEAYTQGYRDAMFSILLFCEEKD